MPADSKSIRTRHKGILFRSKLEADWARALDRLGVPWIYEHEGQYFGDTFYLPDFWLPRSGQFLEVKAIWGPEDCRKAMALLSYLQPHRYAHREMDISLIALEPRGNFYGWARYPYIPSTAWPPTSDPDLLLDREIVDEEARTEALHEFLTGQRRELELARCNRCGGWSFVILGNAAPCRCCGQCPDQPAVHGSPLAWAA